MKTYTVTFFGHRDFCGGKKYQEKLVDILKNIIYEKEYVEFLVGRNGEFDIFATSCIKLVQKDCGIHNSFLTLILPYRSAEYENNKEYFDLYYDEVAYISEGKHFKSAIQARNKYMAERADLVICYVDKKNGGAYDAVMYAGKLGKKVINIGEEDEIEN